ncbi:hypothetical protein HMPREF7215_1086 [Pyramidobacter piscolens W5455]|uniref:Uncharacterized protein n=1 Tax=Pyramidobacter piscolens W5455 TaxID=352165 RepID=A0ABM9ZYA1_9BACT|nr:hypothetical protein HMPREF7215_1086 [Pyramidobacter piscolens W5455]
MSAGDICRLRLSIFQIFPLNYAITFLRKKSAASSTELRIGRICPIVLSYAAFLL